MRIAEIVFSPTGGTKAAADIITEVLSKRFEKEKQTVDLTDDKADFSMEKFAAEDLAVIAVPSYGGRVPAVCSERIRKLCGNGARAVIVCVYGNRAYEDTLAELSDLAGTAGFSVQAAVAGVAEHSIVRDIAAGRPDSKDREALAAFAEKIADKLALKNSDDSLTVPGSRPYKKVSAGGMVPEAGEACTKCGLCAEKCPVRAIDQDDPKKVYMSKCISCMRCVSVCPSSARKLNPVMLGAVQAKLEKLCAERKENELFL